MRPACRPTTRRCAPCAASCTSSSIAAASARSQRTPPSVPEARSDTKLVRAIVHGALAEKREILTEPEAKRVLAAYGIPVVPTEIVLDAAEAAAAAVRIGFPVAVKILSRQITHKSDVGGVALDLGSEQAVLDAVRDDDRQCAGEGATRPGSTASSCSR